MAKNKIKLEKRASMQPSFYHKKTFGKPQQETLVIDSQFEDEHLLKHIHHSLFKLEKDIDFFSFVAKEIQDITFEK